MTVWVRFAESNSFFFGFFFGESAMGAGEKGKDQAGPRAGGTRALGTSPAEAV